MANVKINPGMLHFTAFPQLDPERVTRRTGGMSAQAAWDAAVDAGNDVYCTRMHNIFCDK